jgi:endonuclease-3 related protein
LPKVRLLRIFQRLHAAYGPQHWWPGDTPFEVMVGAVLTQNTAWTNVEKAIANLKTLGRLRAGVIVDLPLPQLALLLKPSGYFNIKAARLRSFCAWLLQQGGVAKLARRDTLHLREALLDVHGVGPETADDILLYAFTRPVFVIDAYTRRLFARLGLIVGTESYEQLRSGFETALGADVALFNEYHALIVHHAKDVCRPRPRCGQCCLARGCPARENQD